MSEDLAVTLSEQAARLAYDDLPPAAVDAAKKLLLNTLGITLAGHAAPGSASIVAYASSFTGAPAATILGSGLRAIAPFATYANAALSNGHDFDDNFDPAPVHAGGAVVPSALAVAESRPDLDGRDLLVAMAAGTDVICRLALGRGSQNPSESPWHSTSLLGYFGSAVTVAKLLGLPAEGIANALGLAYAMTAGSKQCVVDGTPKAIQIGNAAQAGVLAASMSERGVEGAHNPFEGELGLFPVYFRGNYDREPILAELGERHYIAEMSLKPYPSCRYTHSYIDATLDVMKQHAISPQDVEEVVAHVSPGDRHVWEPEEHKRTPRAVIDATFSGQFAIANAIVNRSATLEHYSDTGIADPDVLAMARRVRTEPSPPDTRAIPATRVDVVTTTGRYSSVVDFPSGSPENPLGYADVAAKFRDCARGAAAPVPARSLEEVVETVAALEHERDPGRLATLLAGEPVRA